MGRRKLGETGGLGPTGLGSKKLVVAGVKNILIYLTVAIGLC